MQLPEEKLVLDTSAELYRYLGSATMRDALESIEQEFAVSSVTPFVRKELRYVLRSVYSHVARGLQRVPGPLKRRTFSQIWKEADDIADPVPGIKKLVSSIAVAAAEFFADKRVSPEAASAYIVGARDNLLDRAERHMTRELAHYEAETGEGPQDRSSCCRWIPPDSEFCDQQPGAECRLAKVYQESHKEFLLWVQAVIGSPLPLDEKQPLKKLKPKIDSLESSDEFVHMVAKKPNAFGDLLVYAEAPTDAAILAKDKIFFELSKADAHQTILYLRPPREDPTDDGACTVTCEGGEPVTGLILNYSERRDVRFVLPAKLPSKKSVTVQSSVLGHAAVPCVVRRVDESDRGFEYGVRLRYDRIEQ